MAFGKLEDNLPPLLQDMFHSSMTELNSRRGGFEKQRYACATFVVVGVACNRVDKFAKESFAESSNVGALEKLSEITRFSGEVKLRYSFRYQERGVRRIKPVADACPENIKYAHKLP